MVALLILFPKWGHLPLNSKRFLRYDSSQLGHFRPFSSICMGKSSKFASKCLHFFENFSHQMLQMVSIFRDIKSRDACKGIFVILILLDFLGISVWNFLRFTDFCQKFHHKIPKKCQKIQISKILACVPRFYVSEGADLIWGDLEHLVAQTFKKKTQKFISKFRRFSYVTPISMDHTSATVGS